MQKLLAGAVLAASLAFASGAAFADDRGVVEPVNIAPTQNESVVTQDQSNQSTVAGGSGPAAPVDITRESDGGTSR